MPKPHGFTYEFMYERLGAQCLVITHPGRTAATPRGARAEKFPAEVGSGDAQLVMARWNGSYTFGNERTARNRPRNRR
ncbi:hypothetical protein [Streptomyces sp. NBC_01233]|uniref:hypothetical protein n=1 Tax=Streptomyces sp. NBC_01233 TaxID=2903787 RepID=UPI002E151508|nr:hypothetical protein OG332_11110 [Streptomyces sp. NBC_01233]